jgi:hypothetical protein
MATPTGISEPPTAANAGFATAEMPKALPAPSIPRMIAAHLSEAWSNMAVVADAQINIWTMKVVLALVLGALALPLLAACVALLVYGFILLDGAFAYALSVNLPPWASPLIRGGIYFGIPMIALGFAVYSLVGTSDANDTAEAQEAQQKTEEASHARL